jgi:hypothetical protein
MLFFDLSESADFLPFFVLCFFWTRLSLTAVFSLFFAGASSFFPFLESESFDFWSSFFFSASFFGASSFFFSEAAFFGASSFLFSLETFSSFV